MACRNARLRDVDDIAGSVEPDLLLKPADTAHTLDEPDGLELLTFGRIRRPDHKLLETVLQAVFTGMTACNPLGAFLGNGLRQRASPQRFPKRRLAPISTRPQRGPG